MPHVLKAVRIQRATANNPISVWYYEDKDHPKTIIEDYVGLDLDKVGERKIDVVPRVACFCDKEAKTGSIIYECHFTDDELIEPIIFWYMDAAFSGLRNFYHRDVDIESVKIKAFGNIEAKAKKHITGLLKMVVIDFSKSFRR